VPLNIDEASSQVVVRATRARFKNLVARSRKSRGWAMRAVHPGRQDRRLQHLTRRSTEALLFGAFYATLAAAEGLYQLAASLLRPRRTNVGRQSG
jgi:hypothetical protein